MVELLNEALAKILAGPDYFRCEQLNTKLTKRRCIQRQEAGRWDCRRCEQGKKVREEGEKVRGEEGEKMNYENTRLRRGFGGQAKGRKHEGEKEMEEHTVNEQGMVVEDREKTLICRVCGGDKPLKEMVPNKMCRDGHDKLCLSCRREKNKYYYQARKEQDKSDVKGKVKRRKKQDRPGKRLEAKSGEARPICLVDGCCDDNKNRGLCLRHYRWWREGRLTDIEPFEKGKGVAVKKGLMGRNGEAGKRRDGEAEEMPLGKELPFNPWKAVDTLRGYEDMREELVSAAEDQIRTPEAQVVWYIKRGLEFDRMKKIAARKRGEE